MSINWDLDIETGLPLLAQAYEQQIRNMVYQIVLSYQPRCEVWMKQNASWEDQTGNARQGLYAVASALANAVILDMDHSMWYGFFLEYKNAGKFAVIAPAVDHFFPQIMQDIQAALR